MSKQNIAVIGSGISGLSAAWLLSKHHRVTIFEADDRLGGHANTVDVPVAEGHVAVDTGFIVYNEQNYPNLVALFDHLGIQTDETRMSFALSLNGGAYEYSGSGLTGFFGQKRNIASASHWRLLREISRFFRTAQDRANHYREATTLGTFLDVEGYSKAFVQNHIVPMGAAIWSTSMEDMLAFPARSFLNFYANHGLLQMSGQPYWRTVTNGSREYVNALVRDATFDIKTSTPIKRVIRRPEYVNLVDDRGVSHAFDSVVMAAHANQSLAMLEQPTPQERDLLGKFNYQTNHAVLHKDHRLMPRRKSIWSSWNYIKSAQGLESSLCLSYWMNSLQKLQTTTDLFVTLNPATTIHPKAVEAEFTYEHPMFTAEALRAQRQLWSLQGVQRTWYCGAYFGHGFHEDGIQSGLALAEQLTGKRRPWTLSDPSNRITVSKPVASEAAE